MRFLNWLGPLCLCDSEVLALPPAVPGVYLLQAFVAKLGGYPVFYAGQTEDIQRRLLEHLDDSKAKGSVRRLRQSRSAYFSAAPVSDENLRLQVESGLIRLLKPICNVQTPMIAPVLVNLPQMRLTFEEED